MNIKPNSANNRQSDQAIAREIWRKLVVKIIRWKNGDTSTEKITDKEWKEYYSKTLEINVSSQKAKVLDTLKETYSIIQKLGGFAKD